MPEVEGYGEWHTAADSAQVLGRFEERPVVDERASEEAGDYQYKKIIGIHTRAKHSADISWQRLWPHNTKQLIKRFPEAWAAFQEARDHMGRMPVSKATWIPERFQVECYGLGAETVEELALLEDGEVKPVMGLIKYRDMARAKTEGEAREPEPMDERERLEAMAGTMGIEVDGRWSDETLAEKIEEVRAGAMPEPVEETENEPEDDSDERPE